MKSILILAMVCGVISLSKALTADERKAFEKKLLDECSKKEGSTDADVADMVEHKMPSTRTSKCLHACMVETVGIVKDGKVSVEGTVEISKMAFSGDERLINLAREISEDCKDVTNSDRCEMAVEITQCGMAAAEKRGMKFSDMM